jgi:sigma-B regulation protein RsbU (phosphoserine phosphatase)
VIFIYKGQGMGSDVFSSKTSQAGMIFSPNDAAILKELVETMQYMVRILDSSNNVVYMNKLMRDQFKELNWRLCYEFLGKEVKCEDCVAERAWQSGKSEEKDIKRQDRFFKLMSSPVRLTSGERFSIEVFHDITEHKRIENELVERYKALTADLIIARSIQKGILPKDGIYWNTIKLSSLYLPSDALAGDIYDIIKINKDNYLMYIGDVSGHGVHASLITMFVKEVVRGNLQAAVGGLGFLLESLIKSYVGLDLDPEIYFSLLLCKYNKSKKELSVVNAGHNCYPLIVRKKGGIEEIKAKGLPISKIGGFIANIETSTSLSHGDRLVLFTDGITEEFNEEEQRRFGVEGVKAILGADGEIDGKELADRIVRSASDYSTTRFAKDDRAIMIAEIV